MSHARAMARPFDLLLVGVVFLHQGFSFRHFREIGSNWKYQRTNRVPFDPQVHKTDQALMEAFQRVDWEN